MSADGGAGAAHQLRRGLLFDPGVVAARRLHRLHQAERRPLRDRRHEAGRLGRAHAHRGYHDEGPTWAPNGRVLMFFRDPGGNAGPALYGRHHGPQRAARADPELCVRPGLVAAAELKDGGIARDPGPREQEAGCVSRLEG